MKNVAILYGSTTGNTKSVAELIQKKLSSENVTLFDVSTVTEADLNTYNNLILGASTWGFGDLQDDWEAFLPKLKHMNLGGKVVALYGLGDSEGYSDTFVDGIGHIYNAIKDKGCIIVGQVPSDGYRFSDSVAFMDGKFVGLPIDEDNESRLTEGRISQWIESLTPELLG